MIGTATMLALAMVLATAAAPARPATPPAAGAPVAAPIERQPDGDPKPTSPAGARLGTVKLELVDGLTQVDAQPRTLQVALTPGLPPGIDGTALGAGPWLAGAMPVTKTETIPFAVTQDRTALWLDGDRDGRFSPSERVTPTETVGGLVWFRAHALLRQPGPAEQVLPFRMGIALERPAAMTRLDAFRRGTWTKSAAPPGKKILVAIEDRTFRGWFSHPGRDAILVDADGDGALDASPDSSERYRLGEPFPLGDVDAVVTAIGPFGQTLELARSTQPAARKVSLREGAPAPVFEATAIDGKPAGLKSLRGSWVILDFWATWCGPCRADLPNLKALHAALPAVKIVGISADRERKALESFVASQGMDWPQVFEGAATIQRDYRIAGYPSSFVLAPDGTIAGRDLRGPQMTQTLQAMMTAKGARH